MSRMRGFRRVVFLALMGAGACGASPPAADGGPDPVGHDGDRTDAGDGLGEVPDTEGEANDLPTERDPGPATTTWAPRDVLGQRLSVFLWNQATVDPNIAAALATAASTDDVARIAKDMLRDPRARDGVTAFFRWWLRLGDLSTQPKDDPMGIFTPVVRASLQQEAPAFALSIILDGDGRFETLMTAPYTFMDETLARHYRIDGVTGPQMRQVAFGTPQRIGLLGEAGVLARFAGNTNPTWPPRRFWLIRQTLLCRTGLESSVPINTSGIVIQPGMPLRKPLDDVTSRAECMSCHAFVNPFGDAFLSFNTFGQLWSNGPAGPFDDSSGRIPASDTYFGAELTFTDQPDLIRQLVARPETRACFTWLWLNFAVDRPRSSEVNTFSRALEPSLPSAAADFEASGGDIRELLLAIVRTPSFLQTATPIVMVDAGAG